MRRLSLLVFLAAVCALLIGAVSSGAAREPSAARAPLTLSGDVFLHVDLGKSHGIRGEIEAERYGDEAVVKVTLLKDSQEAVYSVPGVVTPNSIEADFGEFGTIALNFQATETVATNPPGPKCKGRTGKFAEGIFTGTANFAGEHGFVEFSTTRANGDSDEFPEQVCDFRSARPPASAYKAKISAVDPARTRVFLAAVADSKVKRVAKFIGASSERRGRVQIVRVSTATASKSHFRFDPAAGTATVRPPAPFLGSAHAERRRHGRDLWRGSLRVRLLGAPPLPLTKHGVEARLEIGLY